MPCTSGRMLGGCLAQAFSVALFVGALLGWSVSEARAQRGAVVSAKIQGAIGVGTRYYIEDVLATAVKDKAQLIVLNIDTPGGLVSATREIIQLILASSVPIAVYVSPSGARAASAGTYIVYAAHVVAMAPGTHLGAATPIRMQMPGLPQAPKPPADGKPEKPGGVQDAAKSKMINDAVAYLRTLAQLRGRSEKWADKFVTDAATLTATEALKEGVVDIVAADLNGLLQKIDGRRISLDGAERVLDVKGAPVTSVEPNWKVQFLTAITDPNVAFILLLIGIYGIIFEFWSPGLAGPGVVGGICLIIAFTALSALPLNAAGLALLALGIALMAAEAFAPGFGILGLGGIVAFIAGAIFLFDPAGADIDLSIAWPLITAAAVTSALVLIGLLGFIMRARRQPVVTGREELIGLEGEVVSWDGDSGRVHIHGENWAARSASSFAKGDRVLVSARDGLTLIVDSQ